jgi:hypothetical protein
MDVVNEDQVEFNTAWGQLQLVASEKVFWRSHDLVLVTNGIQLHETWRFCEQADAASPHCDSWDPSKKQPKKVENREYWDAIAEFLGDARHDIYPED